MEFEIVESCFCFGDSGEHQDSICTWSRRIIMEVLPLEERANVVNNVVAEKGGHKAYPSQTIIPLDSFLLPFYIL